MNQPNRRTTLAAASFISTIAFATSYGLSPVLLEAISGEFDVSSKQLGSAISFVQFFTFLLTVISIGLFAAHIRKRVLLTVATVLLAVALAGVARAPMASVMVAGLGVAFVGCGTIELTTSTLMVRLYPRRSRAMLNISQVFFGFGVVGGPLLAIGLLRHFDDWRLPFLVTAGLALAALPFYAAGRADEGQAQARIRSTHILELISKKRFWTFAIIMVLYVGMELGFAFWVPSYLGDKYRLSADHGARALAPMLFWGMMTLGRFGIAFIPDRVRHTTVILSIMIACVVAFALFLAAPTMPLKLAASGLLGLAMSGLWPTNLALAESHFPERHTTVIALIIAAGALGAAVFPPIVGQLAIRIGLERAMSMLLGVGVAGAIVAGLAHWRLPPPPRTAD